MGDIGTHADISRFVIDQAGKIPGNTIPVTDYAFLELGNFLTDVSQFRDPAAYHRAREQARSTAGFGGKIFGSADWVSEVFGQMSGPRHGALPEMLKLLMSATTHLVFDSDALPLAGELVDAMTSRGPSILLAHGIPPQDVAQVLQTNYTQYFPHEHLDATPLPTGQVPTLQNQPDFARGQRNLLAYLDRDLLFLSEQLSWLEASWRITRERKLMDDGLRRQYALANLGHILHAVEDYFFHSNLPEAHVWAAARADKLKSAPGQEPSRADLMSAALRRTTLDPASTPLRRLLNRRLRFPVYQAQGKLSTTQSEDATAFIYTGGFGQTDVWHTLGGALEALEDQLKLLPAKFAKYDPRNTSLVLFKMLLSQSARAEMVASKTLDAQRELHLKQLRAGEYHEKIKQIAKDYPVCEHTVKALLDAFDLDLAVSKKYDGRIATFPGPGAVLITMMDTMETEREASAAAKAKLDNNAASADGLAADNGCSAENIGTHTLMSKDATSKEPLRAAAVALAKHASASIAVRFLSSVTQPAAAANAGLDWDAELRSFIRGVTPGGWETDLLAAVSQPNFRQPDVGSLPHQPAQAASLGPANDPNRLAARRGLTTTHDLETYYKSLES
jgi:hypothetical protein